jgi:hypothetical protein
MTDAARLDAFSHLLREGASGIRASPITTPSSWIEYESMHDWNVSLDGEPTEGRWHLTISIQYWDAQTGISVSFSITA